MIKLFTIYVYLQTLFCGCGPDVRRSGFERLRSDYKVQIERIGKLDKRIPESSGLAHALDSTYWTHPDGGPNAVLYAFDLDGKLVKEVELPFLNKDWEDLSEDSEGNLYIGDFGNNANTRRDLAIYKFDSADISVKANIFFSFKDQQNFPPAYQDRHYDVEAFFHRSDSLYLFSKSRAFRSITKLYVVPDQEGNYSLSPKGALQVKSPITAAVSAPNQKEFSLLGYGRLYLFQPETEQVSLNSKRYCLTVGRTGQAEGLLYLSPTQLLISNERGKLYLVTLQKK